MSLTFSQEVDNRWLSTDGAHANIYLGLVKGKIYGTLMCFKEYKEETTDNVNLVPYKRHEIFIGATKREAWDLCIEKLKAIFPAIDENSWQ